MKQYVVVFDLDETLGFFSTFGVLCSSLNFVLQDDKFHQDNFNQLLDLYPEFLRPGIFDILKYLKNKKHLSSCNKIIIYTNNQGPREWTIQIKDYLNDKIKYNLFDHIIAAFKVNGKRVELGRTSHEKNIGDFLNCTKLPKSTKIFFLDDQYHMGMEDKNVYYINIFPYVYDLPWDIMIDRFWKKYKNNSRLSDFSEEVFKRKMTKYINNYNVKPKIKSQDEYEAEKVVSMQIITHLKEFFSTSRNRTPKRNKQKGQHKRTYKK